MCMRDLLHVHVLRVLDIVRYVCAYRTSRKDTCIISWRSCYVYINRAYICIYIYYTLFFYSICIIIIYLHCVWKRTLVSTVKYCPWYCTFFAFEFRCRVLCHANFYAVRSLFLFFFSLSDVVFPKCLGCRFGRRLNFCVKCQKIRKGRFSRDRAISRSRRDRSSRLVPLFWFRCGIVRTVAPICALIEYFLSYFARASLPRKYRIFFYFSRLKLRQVTLLERIYILYDSRHCFLAVSRVFRTRRRSSGRRHEDKVIEKLE